MDDIRKLAERTLSLLMLNETHGARVAKELAQAVLSAEQTTGEGLGRLLQCVAECRDAMSAARPYMEGTSFTFSYACRQVDEQIARCKLAIEAFNRQPSAKPGTVITGDIRAEVVTAGE